MICVNKRCLNNNHSRVKSKMEKERKRERERERERDKEYVRQNVKIIIWSHILFSNK